MDVFVQKNDLRKPGHLQPGLINLPSHHVQASSIKFRCRFEDDTNNVACTDMNCNLLHNLMWMCQYDLTNL